MAFCKKNAYFAKTTVMKSICGVLILIYEEISEVERRGIAHTRTSFRCTNFVALFPSFSELGNKASNSVCF